MIRIELDTFEQKDLLEYLNYAMEQKEINRPVSITSIRGGSSRFDTTTYDIMRISQLIEQIKNPHSRTNVYKSATYEDYISRNKNNTGVDSNEN